MSRIRKLGFGVCSRSVKLRNLGFKVLGLTLIPKPPWSMGLESRISGYSLGLGLSA